ncbi:MAG: UPF0236 family protein [Lachnospiraceae bacterium]|nr:UPF0236 family protein [Lachnospiraceae bacterium]
MLKNNANLTRKLIGTFGEIQYSRASLIPADKNSARILRETENRKSVFPLDIALGVGSLPFKISCQMMCAIARETVRARSYSDASTNIEEKYHVTMSSVQVEKVTDFVGAIVYDEQLKEAEIAEGLSHNKVDGRLRRRRKNDILYLEVDGAMVHVRDKKDGDGWMESKHAIAFNSSNVHYYQSGGGEITGHRILSRDFTGYIGSADDFKYHFYALAKRNDCDHCSELVVISDGALWIHDIVKELLPKATHILDLYHAKENAGKFAQAVKRGKNQKKEFADELCDLIDSGNVSGLLKVLEPYKEEKFPPGVLNFYKYVENHKDCMNYPLYKSKGYFVGSGAIESGNIRLMQNRMKLQGMRWKLSSGQCMLSLKAKYESNKWDEVESLMQRYCYPNGDC